MHKALYEWINEERATAQKLISLLVCVVAILHAQSFGVLIGTYVAPGSHELALQILEELLCQNVLLFARLEAAGIRPPQSEG